MEYEVFWYSNSGWARVWCTEHENPTLDHASSVKEASNFAVQGFHSEHAGEGWQFRTYRVTHEETTRC
jgi:hypothetical protein